MSFAEHLWSALEAARALPAADHDTTIPRRLAEFFVASAGAYRVGLPVDVEAVSKARTNGPTSGVCSNRSSGNSVSGLLATVSA
jgi:hypothetical protein